MFELKASPGHKLCIVKGCRNAAAHHKAGLCHRHHQTRFRMRHARSGLYASLRDHAKQRGLEFRLGYDYFRGMVDALAYHDRGAETRGEVPTFDRIDPTKGYVEGNLRIITLSDNAAKSNRERYLPEHVQCMLERRRERARENPWLESELPGDERDPF